VPIVPIIPLGFKTVRLKIPLFKRVILLNPAIHTLTKIKIRALNPNTLNFARDEIFLTDEMGNIIR
jgi:hypothetical protein